MRQGYFPGAFLSLMAAGMLAGSGSVPDFPSSGPSYPRAPNQPKPRERGEGPRPAHTHRGHKRNCFFGRVPVGNTNPGNRFKVRS